MDYNKFDYKGCTIYEYKINEKTKFSVGLDGFTVESSTLDEIKEVIDNRVQNPDGEKHG